MGIKFLFKIIFFFFQKAMKKIFSLPKEDFLLFHLCQHVFKINIFTAKVGLLFSVRPVVHECHITGQNSIFISDRPNEDNDMKQTQIDR